MSAKVIVAISVVFFFLSQGRSQDIVVQAFNYSSTTRDTIIDFPEVDHNEFEKILMVYNMRCKDGKISPPIPGRTNEGCGEWDYSCNTYITDESQTDSVKASSPTHEISSFSGDVFPYTSQPTYSYFESVQKNVTSTSSGSAVEYTFGAEDSELSFNDNANRIQFLYTVDQLGSVGMSSGVISGLKLDVKNTFGDVKNLRIKLKNTSKVDLSSGGFETRGFTTVYYLDRALSTAEDDIYFFRPYNWNGNANIIVDISYDAASGVQPILNAEVQDKVKLLQSENIDRRSLEFNRGSYIRPSAENLDVSDEITIALWAKGGFDLPFNSTICEGVDANNNRQVNIHFPWSDGVVYWDCGNDGTGFDRINKGAGGADYKNKWNHWAFTKNASSGSMKIYLNGTLWHSGTGNHKQIDVQSFVIGGGVGPLWAYQGNIDQFSIWNKELSGDNIKSWMGDYITTDHPNYNDLLLYYNFDNEQGDVVVDQSPNQNNGNIDGPFVYREINGQDISIGIEQSMSLPIITFIQDGDAAFESTDIIKLDSLINLVNQIKEYTLSGTDRVLVGTSTQYFAGEMPVYNEAGAVIRTIDVAPENTIGIGVIDYFRKSPMKYEIMSFVTPYGINLDLGLEGKTWTFDVTDFGPLLHGSRRLNMERGGEWQEEMDIKFVFVKGTPSRDVHAISQVWPVTSSSYVNILDQKVFEPREVLMDGQSSMFKLKAAITGHGQQGEFIQRAHMLNVDGYTEREWNVWKECFENPVYPQGGTWIYNRAGWCPGMATDIEELDLTELVTPGQSSTIDYDISTASGDSRYIVNVQMVSYGEPNFVLDAELADVINPSNKIEYGRFNPICRTPKVLIKNNGETRLTSLDIIYGINGAEQTYNWTGSLNFLETEEVELNMLDLQSIARDGGTFMARVSNPNGSADTYENNNEMSTMFDVVPVHKADVMINFKTNNAGSETSYWVEDDEGNVILARNGALPANREYRDTLFGLEGCYKMIVRDLGADGLDFFANNAGTGFIRIKDVDGAFTVLEPDFGRSIVYEFIAGTVVLNTEDELKEIKNVSINPNPGSDVFKINFKNFSSTALLEVVDQAGKTILTQYVDHIDEVSHEYYLDLSTYKNGVYFVKIKSDNEVRSLKLIKVN